MGKSGHTGTGACWDSRCVRPAGREHSDSQQEERESHHPPRLSQKHLDTLSEEPGDRSPRRKTHRTSTSHPSSLVGPDHKHLMKKSLLLPKAAFILLKYSNKLLKNSDIVKY